MLKADVAIRLANERRRPVRKATAQGKRATTPAHRLIMDASGPFASKCVATGAYFELSAVDEATTRGWVKSTKTHTIDDWVEFVREVRAECSQHGHTIMVI